MLKVRCMLCIQKVLAEMEKGGATEDQQRILVEKRPYDIFSTTIAKGDEEAVTLLGVELAKHIQSHHGDEFNKLGMWQAFITGFNVMKNFESEDKTDLFEVNKETAREKIMEEILKFATDDDEDDEDDELEDDEDECEEDDEEDFEDDDDEEEEDTLCAVPIAVHDSELPEGR